jgi:uncharacterized SAM-binding protein YcdF (DUF218 family)
MWLLSPLSWLLLAGLGAGVAWWLQRRRWWLACVALAVVATLAMTPLVANALLDWLEAERPAPASCRTTPPAVAVVLAGGVDALPRDGDDIVVLGIASRRRVEHAVAWWRARPGRALVFSGGPQALGGVAESRLMFVYAQRFGVAESAMRYETESTNTRENARGLDAMRPSLPRRVVLVTSALHMPRARYALQRTGFEVCPLATDFRRVPFGLPGALVPQRSALEKTEAALHEWVGMGWYRWRDFGSARRTR